MIIATGMTSKGVEYAIDDTFMAPRESDEERRIIETQRRVAHDILIGWAKRHEKEKSA